MRRPCTKRGAWLKVASWKPTHCVQEHNGRAPRRHRKADMSHPMKVRNAPLSLPGQPAPTLIRRSTMKHILIAAALLTGLIATGFSQSQEERRVDGQAPPLSLQQHKHA